MGINIINETNLSNFLTQLQGNKILIISLDSNNNRNFIDQLPSNRSTIKELIQDIEIVNIDEPLKLIIYINYLIINEIYKNYDMIGIYWNGLNLNQRIFNILMNRLQKMDKILMTSSINSVNKWV
ncbi:hypothetical protein WICMUC_005552 [Wickerhamomyces mucosus]|uniref:Uncharacterized protein n=1 Tax=Wickerhamomyces mucosus TaxID=1378264 RepID=A0A9P8T555_9ASCO|nr:hypothetical protein WICMUC_005552 [Wickerhamomyces mucosus]